ncbi:EEF1A lysine methyltransferase 3-like [Scleropages formosus]|uniref:EEF1A lysine methyltransferase 3 n=1 Tax=Scleropages formosus TaxID=113540 RepID=A0A8C9S872_SCLFO|nr:EEF1A lysine methyltransferase 3 [Scleropages formosus]
MTSRNEELEEGALFPVEDGLFADCFSEEAVYRFGEQELKISQLFGASLGVAAPVWDAAVCLCRYVEEAPLDVSGRRVIELGSGTGIVGILAARLGADVTLTDLPHAIPQLKNNVTANTPPLGWPFVTPSVLPLSWGLDHDRFPSDWDLVLGADIVYLSETYSLLLDTLTHLCKNGATLYLSSKMRAEHGTPDFYDNILSQRFNCQLVCCDALQNINIYRATLRRGGE